MLTPAQFEARRGKLTASRVSVLMTGDARGILQLYLEMTDDPSFEPKDLSRVWPVQLGSATEALNLDWYEMQGSAISRRGEVVVHPAYPWAAATIDGWDSVLRCPVETKHVGGYEPLEVVIERYQPQMQWQMECTRATQCALSVIMGASAPVVEYIERAPEYAAEMIMRGQQFMHCVVHRVVPVALEAVPAPIDISKVYDMTGNNSWAAAAIHWLNTKLAARECQDSEKILKSVVPEDAKKCFGHGIQITRDRAGRLSLREVTL